MDQVVRRLGRGQLLETRIHGEKEHHRRRRDRFGSLTEHERLFRRFRADEGFRESQFDGPDLIGDLRESSRGLSRVSVRALRRDVCSAADIPAGLEQAGFELGEEGRQGRLRVEGPETHAETRRRGGPEFSAKGEARRNKIEEPEFNGDTEFWERLGRVLGNCDCFSGTRRGRP